MTERQKFNFIRILKRIRESSFPSASNLFGVFLVAYGHHSAVQFRRREASRCVSPRGNGGSCNRSVTRTAGWGVAGARTHPPPPGATLKRRGRLENSLWYNRRERNRTGKSRGRSCRFGVRIQGGRGGIRRFLAYRNGGTYSFRRRLNFTLTPLDDARRPREVETNSVDDVSRSRDRLTNRRFGRWQRRRRQSRRRERSSRVHA